MQLPYAASIQALARPGRAFTPPPPSLGQAVRGMILVWLPLAFLNAAWTVHQAIQAYDRLRLGGSLPGILGRFGLEPEELQAMVRLLPASPSFGRVWPWLGLGVPLVVLGTWCHHAVWDHAGLWLLGGLKEQRGFRTTLVAEAEALRIAAVGTLAGFLGFVPVLGWVLALPLALLNAYLWLFRGFALAARHGCEPWRGIAATVVHAVLLAGFALLLVSLLLVLLRVGA